MIKAGLVNMDTSHPRCFAEVMRRMGRIRYSAIYDDSFRSPTEIKEFMEIYGLEERCASLEELADSTDVGFIHGCNWDDHLRCAEPFWRRGKPVFIDKPLVGCLRDCRRVRDWVERGAVILGSSSVRYAEEIKRYRWKPEVRLSVFQPVWGWMSLITASISLRPSAVCCLAGRKRSGISAEPSGLDKRHIVTVFRFRQGKPPL